MEDIVNRGKQLLADMTTHQMRGTPRETTNPQLLWAAFKSDIRAMAKQTEKAITHKKHAWRKRIERDLQETASNPNLDHDESVRYQEAFLMNTLTHREKQEARKTTAFYRALAVNHGEKLGGIWSARSKEVKP